MRIMFFRLELLVIVVIFNGILRAHSFTEHTEIKDSAETEEQKNEPKKQQQLTMDPEKIDVILHTAAVITFLQSKAKSIITQHPTLSGAEGVVYKQCAAEAQNAVQLAQCVVRLLRARDRLYSADVDDPSRSFTDNDDGVLRGASSATHPSDDEFDRTWPTPAIGEVDWLTQFRQMLWPTLRKSDAGSSMAGNDTKLSLDNDTNTVPFDTEEFLSMNDWIVKKEDEARRNPIRPQVSSTNISIPVVVAKRDKLRSLNVQRLKTPVSSDHRLASNRFVHHLNGIDYGHDYRTRRSLSSPSIRQESLFKEVEAPEESLAGQSSGKMERFTLDHRAKLGAIVDNSYWLSKRRKHVEGLAQYFAAQTSFDSPFHIFNQTGGVEEVDLSPSDRVKRRAPPPRFNLLDLLRPGGMDRFFRPNVAQKRREAKKRRRSSGRRHPTGADDSGGGASAAKAAITRGVPPRLPWYMEPVMQTINSARDTLLAGLMSGASSRRRKVKKFSPKHRKADDTSRTRNKRHVGSYVGNGTDELPPNDELKNIKNLRLIAEFFQMSERCKRFMKQMGDSNAEFLSQFSDGAKYTYGTTTDTVAAATPTVEERLVDELTERLKRFALFRRLPILSPRLFSVLPDGDYDDEEEDDVNGSKAVDDEEQQRNRPPVRPSVLSPNLFSFHRQGVFSLPTLFQFVSTDKHEMLAWFDLFIHMAGADVTIERLLAEIQPKADALRRLHDVVQRLDAYQRRFARVKHTLSDAQRRALQRHDYVLLDDAQLVALYDTGEDKTKWTRFTNDYRAKREAVDESLLENDIYSIAELSADDMVRAEQLFRSSSSSQSMEGGVHKDSITNGGDAAFGNNTESNITLKGVDSVSVNTSGGGGRSIDLLRPFGFANRLSDGPVLNQVLLSPRAFAMTLLSPRFMRSVVLSPVAFVPAIASPNAMLAVVLSPTAFTANVLSPNTLYADVLSPKFFHVNVLSPRALSALVLSPRTMVAEVLSPKMVEFRVLNPAAFHVAVLTPNLVMPRVLSPANFAVSVLSPNILSPSVLSKGNFTIQILSPSIMSGNIKLSATNGTLV